MSKAKTIVMTVGAVGVGVGLARRRAPPERQPAPGAGAPLTARTEPSTVPGVPPVHIDPSDDRAMARELALHLATLQLALKSLKAAQGRENQSLVRAFQTKTGIYLDGLAGPGTYVAIARRLDSGTVPLVMYWPKGATEKTVLAYRTALRAIAEQAPEPVKSALRASANRERGQGAKNGPLIREDSEVIP
jgi:hypothetical protein